MKINFIYDKDWSIEVKTDGNGFGVVHSTGLEQVCPGCDCATCDWDCDSSQSGTVESDEDHNNRLQFNAAINGLLSFILAQACAGIDISSKAYRTAVITAIEAIRNNYD